MTHCFPLRHTAVDYTFFHKDFALFNENFLKPMQNLSFLTSITYNLPPSTIHLVNVEVQMVHGAFYLEVGWIFEVARMRVDFSEVFVSERLIGREFIQQPIKNAVSYRHLSVCWERTLQIFVVCRHMFVVNGRFGCSWPDRIMTTEIKGSDQVKINNSKIWGFSWRFLEIFQKKCQRNSPSLEKWLHIPGNKI